MKSLPGLKTEVKRGMVLMNLSEKEEGSSVMKYTCMPERGEGSGWIFLHTPSR
jgi:hypothetical protein